MDLKIKKMPFWHILCFENKGWFFFSLTFSSAKLNFRQLNAHEIVNTWQKIDEAILETDKRKAINLIVTAEQLTLL